MVLSRKPQNLISSLCHRLCLYRDGICNNDNNKKTGFNARATTKSNLIGGFAFAKESTLRLKSELVSSLRWKILKLLQMKFKKFIKKCSRKTHVARARSRLDAQSFKTQISSIWFFKRLNKIWNQLNINKFCISCQILFVTSLFLHSLSYPQLPFSAFRPGFWVKFILQMPLC